MQYLQCTYVDAITRVPVHMEPAANGPGLPSIDGLACVFSDESQYPTLVPHFYCTAPDGVSADVPGVLAVLTEVEFEAARAAEIEARKAQFLEHATAARKAVEFGGIDFAGARIATAVEDQNRITSVVANAELAGVESVDFKAESGWVQLTFAQIKAISAAIARHVQACYSAERAHHEAIAQLQTLEDVSAYNVYAGWPGQDAAEPVEEEAPEQD